MSFSARFRQVLAHTEASVHTVGGTQILRHYFDDCEDVLIFSLAVQKHVWLSYRVPYQCVHIIWDEPESVLFVGSGLSDIRYRLQGTVTFQALTEDSCPMLIVPDCDGLWECLVCGDPCVDVECAEGDNNCSVCGICSLCPFCHVHVGRGSWRCFYCLTKLQVEQLSLSPRTRRRIALTFPSWRCDDDSSSSSS